MLTQNQDAPEDTAAPATPAPTKLNVRPDLFDESYSPEQYQQMMAMYEGTLQHIEEGEIVKSRVLRVTENAVILDVGFKSEGAVPIEEFKDPKSLKEGDEIEVFLESDEPVEGTLVKKIKGGVVVDLMGVDAFLPGSQIALRRVPNIDELL